MSDQARAFFMMGSLKTLIHQCAQGNQKAQRRLYDQLKGKLLGVCCRYSHSADEAKDVFQEAMIKIFKNIEKAKEVANFYAWANRIIINTAIDTYKKNKAEMFVNLSESEMVQFSDEEANAMQKMEAAEILELLRKLPENQMLVFNLYMIEGHRHKKIASKLSIAESTSRVLLTRAKRKIVEMIKKTEVHEQICG